MPQLVLAEHVAWRKIEDGAVLLDLETSAYYSFNQTGARLLEMISQGMTSEAMAEVLVDEYQVASDQALKDVARFRSDLARKKLAALGNWDRARERR